MYKLIPSVSATDLPHNLDALYYLGVIHTSASDENVDDVLLLIKSCQTDVDFIVDVTKVTDRIVDILNGGARKVIATPKQAESLDKERVILSEGPGGHYVFDGTVKPGYVSLAKPSAAAILELPVKENIIVPAFLLTADAKAEPNLLPIAKVLLKDAPSDRPDGLFPTVVTDERGIALGLVYSSHESVSESFRTGTGVYQSRERGLWYKGATSGDTQELVRVELDCDQDCLKFTVRQKGNGFCHLLTATCFGGYSGLAKLEKTLLARKASAPEGSYTARLFSSQELLQAKIMEEAEELCTAEPGNVAFEAADLIYFALTRCIASGVSLRDVERELDKKALKVTRRKGDAKEKWAGLAQGKTDAQGPVPEPKATSTETELEPDAKASTEIKLRRYDASTPRKEIEQALQRPSQKSSETIMGIVNPIIEDVRTGGDKALLGYTHKFEKAVSLTSPVLRAPFPAELMQLSPETKAAIDTSFDNILKFHSAQKESKPLVVETMPGVVCSRFMRPIQRVGLYVPGGTAVLPSTALMLGVPAMVAGCEKIVLASPPRADGSVTPEIVYIAHKVGAESIVLAGGAQAVAALAYGTESVSKVDKILGPGNQFVTAAKMVVSNDTSAGVAIDMPAGPSEVLVIADTTANPAFVASDLLSQAEHGVDSQVVLIAVGLDEQQLAAIEAEVHAQAMALPRVDIVRGAINHSVTLQVSNIEEAMELSNYYAPEHLILQVDNAPAVIDLVKNAGSCFIGPWTPESVGDYSAGVNHSLPTYGYARQYSGVNLGSYVKHITSSHLSAEGLRNVGGAVMQLAAVETLDAHKRAVSIRLQHLDPYEANKLCTNMSSLRNAVQRRNHKERSQPQERSKWGLLEKHKDYSLRARDFNQKKARLKALREKAALRNPDEFSYKMLSSRTDEHGRLVADRGNAVLSQSVVRLLKTQDAGYLRTMAQIESKRLQRLEHGSVLSGGQKTVFVDDVDAQQRYNGPASVELNTADPQRIELSRHRLDELRRAEQELTQQRARMGKSSGGETKAGQMFKARERKR